MKELLLNLSELLKEEKKVYETLLQILAKELEAVTSHNLLLLNEAVVEKETETLNLKFLENKRSKVISAVAHRIDRPKDSLSMPFLVKLADESCAITLMDSWKALIPVVENTRRMARRNKDLMEKSLHFVKDAVCLLERICMHNPIYSQTGRKNQKQLSGKVLRGAI